MLHSRCKDISNGGCVLIYNVPVLFLKALQVSAICSRIDNNNLTNRYTGNDCVKGLDGHKCCSKS